MNLSMPPGLPLALLSAAEGVAATGNAAEVADLAGVAAALVLAGVAARVAALVTEAAGFVPEFVLLLLLHPTSPAAAAARPVMEAPATKRRRDTENDRVKLAESNSPLPLLTATFQPQSGRV